MPIAPVPLFGVAQKLSQGHAVTTILLAMVAMTLTAFSYGRMAALYPAAGSAYTYVGRGLNPHLGFLAGWAMFLDYLLVPLLCTIYGALTVHRLVPQIPYAVWAALFAGAMTVVNLRGIRATVNTNLVLLVVMSTVIIAFMVLAVRMLFHQQGWPGLFSTAPFYDPSKFHLASIATGTSLAALTYGGFDGVTTLAEDVENPRRNVLLATVFVCLFTGIFGGLQIYLAQRVWPDFTTFPEVETAFMDVTRLVAGAWLFHAVAGILILASLGAGLSAQAGVSRLLFGMGRDNVLPRRVFAYLDPKRNTPTYSILLVGLFAFLGALRLNYERTAELINFGAFLAFMGVNASVIRQFYFRNGSRDKRLLWDALTPALGFLFCLIIWLSLPTPAKVMGALWFLVGIAYDAVKTRGFRTAPAMVDFSES
ncbi:MAG: APC family permease [Acidobacteria bacterium]|nr:APC family permease [Acidobacteriota bacterium]